MSNPLIRLDTLIDEISMGPFGSDIKVENFVDYGVPVLNGANLTGFKLTEDEFKYVTKEKAKTYKKAIAKKGDIVITHRGTLGQISYIPNDSKFEEYVISQSQFRVSFKKNKIDPAFFVYYFHTSEGQKRLLANKCHVGVPALAQATTNFKLIKIPLPDLFTQQKIAAVLSSLDSKIALNNRINNELESMAKTLYDYWFVQFDFPTPAEYAASIGRPEMAGKPYKSSGGKMVWNKELKREIPEGWKAKPLSEITNVSIESESPMNYPNKEYKHYSIPEFDLSGTYKIEKGKEIKSNKFKIEKGDILVSKLNPWFNRVIHAAVEEDLICSTEFVVWRTHNIGVKNYLFMTARDINFIKYCTKSASGTSNSHKRVNPSVMMKYKIAYNYNFANLFGNKLESTIKRLSMNKVQNQHLSSLRDWLLPMLMNGQVRVAETADKEEKIYEKC